MGWMEGPENRIKKTAVKDMMTHNQDARTARNDLMDKYADHVALYSRPQGGDAGVDYMTQRL